MPDVRGPGGVREPSCDVWRTATLCCPLGNEFPVESLPSRTQSSDPASPDSLAGDTHLSTLSVRATPFSPVPPRSSCAFERHGT